MNGRVVPLLLLLLSLLLVPSAADVIWPGPTMPPLKSIPSCFEISNINDFPDYLIAVKIIDPRDLHYQYQLVSPGICVSNSDFRVYAIRREYFNAIAAEADYSYFDKDPYTIGSPVIPFSRPYVSLNSSQTGLKEIFKIISINSTRFELEKIESIPIYTKVISDFSKENSELNETNSELPKGAVRLPDGYSDLEFTALILAGLAALGIAVQILIRRKGK